MDKNRVITEAVEKDDPTIISKFLNCSIEDILQSKSDSYDHTCKRYIFSKIRGKVYCNDLSCIKCPFSNDIDNAINWLKKGIEKLTVDDLVKGEIYLVEYDSERSYINLSNGKDSVSHYVSIRFNSFEYDGSCLGAKSYRLATNSERKWLKTCMKQDKFIPESELDKYDDEGNLVENKSEFEVGKWYNICDTVYLKLDCFKDEILYGSEYIYIKHNMYRRSSISFYTKWFNGFKATKVDDLSGIQQYLPEGHVDLILKPVEYTSTPIEPKYPDCDSLTDILIDFSKPAGSKMLDPIAWINGSDCDIDGLHPSKDRISDAVNFFSNLTFHGENIVDLLEKIPNKYNYKYYEPEDDPIVHTWHFQRESVKYSDL